MDFTLSGHKVNIIGGDISIGVALFVDIDNTTLRIKQISFTVLTSSRFGLGPAHLIQEIIKRQKESMGITLVRKLQERQQDMDSSNYELWAVYVGDNEEERSLRIYQG